MIDPGAVVLRETPEGVQISDGGCAIVRDVEQDGKSGASAEAVSVGGRDVGVVAADAEADPIAIGVEEAVGQIGQSFGIGLRVVVGQGGDLVGREREAAKHDGEPELEFTGSGGKIFGERAMNFVRSFVMVCGPVEQLPEVSLKDGVFHGIGNQFLAVGVDEFVEDCERLPA